MNRLLKSIHVLSGALIILPGMAFAQISITANDILGLIGSAQTIEGDTTANVAVNVGSAGANQAWDFTSVPIRGLSTTQNFVAPAGTPFEADFPTANFVLVVADPSGDQGLGEAIVYQYFEVTSSSLSTLGGGAVVPSLDTSLVTFEAQDVAPLPLTFNSSWISTVSDTFGDPATFASVSLDTSVNTVDGWGTVQLPIGSFDCLRVRSDSKGVAKTFIGGVVTSTETTNTIGYTWVSKDNFIVADAESQDNDTNPNFTNASSFQRLASVATGVEDRSESPKTFELSQNYPNPFNPETLINYRIPEGGRVELTVYNLLGQKIKTLVDQELQAGSYQIKWDGSDDFGNRAASGLYLYQLKVGRFANARKMVLLQ